MSFFQGLQTSTHQAKGIAMSATLYTEQIQQLEASLKAEDTGLSSQTPSAATLQDMGDGMASAYRDMLLRIADESGGGVVKHDIDANATGATVTDQPACVTNPVNGMVVDDPLARGVDARIFCLEDGEDTSTYLTTEHGGLLLTVHANGEVRIESASQKVRTDDILLAEGINWDYLTALKRD